MRNPVLTALPRRSARLVRHSAALCRLLGGERFADRHLKTAREMERLFLRYLKDSAPVARTLELAARCTFSLDELQYQYLDEIRTPRSRNWSG